MKNDLPVLLFDVNETLLDLAPFKPVFVKMFGQAEALREWFEQVVVYSSAVTFADAYVDASAVGAAVLSMMAKVKHLSLRAEDLTEFKRIASEQPIYADVLPGLRALKAAGFRMVTLSNNPTKSTDDALHRNGIFEFFERTFSIDDRIHRYKPAPETYRAVAAELALAPQQLCLISCHAFDILGAAAVGLRTTMILRPENAPISLGQQPEIVSVDMMAAAEALTAKYVPST